MSLMDLSIQIKSSRHIYFFQCLIYKLSTEDKTLRTAGSECTNSVYIRYTGVVIAGHIWWLSEVFGC